MGKILLVELLNSFTKQELSNFMEFSNCRYHNTDEYATVLLKFLRDKVIFKTDFDDLLQCEAFKKAFPTKPKPSEKLNKTQKGFLSAKMNVLIRLAENFLCYEGLKYNSANKMEILLNQLLEKNQTTLFNRIVNKEKKKLDGITAKSIENYKHCYSLEYGILENINRLDLLAKKDNLSELNQNLDTIYILNKLSIEITCRSLLNISAKKAYNFNILKDLQQLLKKQEYFDNPLIKANIISSNLLQTNQHKYYANLIELLDSNLEMIPLKDLKAFYLVANNFCIKKIKEGNEEYYKNMFELFQKMDENDLIMDNNFIQIGILKNVTSIACKVQKYNWAMQMIAKYKPFIQKEFQYSVYHFNSGAVAFYQNKYKTALNHFIKVDNFNLAYDIDCRMMILKCHYELDTDYDERTMRVFVVAERYMQTNRKLVLSDKKAYKNFIRILLNVYRVKHKATRMTKESLLYKIEKAEFISDKNWLLKKIEDLKR